MALKIYPENQPKPRQRFSDDFVGQLHSGYQLDGVPSALEEWRITTGDPDVAERVHELYKGEAAAIDVVMADSKAIRQWLTLWDRDRNPVCIPSAELTFRLAEDPNLGIFVLKSNSWGLAHFLAAEDIEGQIEAIGGPAIIRLKLVPVSFTAKNGPRKGKLVSYTSTEIEVIGAVEREA